MNQLENSLSIDCRKAWLLHVDPENNVIQDKIVAPAASFRRSHLHSCSQHLTLSNTIDNCPKTTIANIPKFTPLIITPYLFPLSR